MIDLRVRGLGNGRAVRVVLGNERRGMIVMRRRRIFPRMTMAGADERDCAGNNRAKERQKDDRFVHFKNRAVQSKADARQGFLAGA
jgi:hypothetical protein